MEIMCACQAIDLRGNNGLGIGTKAAYELVREEVEKLVDDRPLYDDINRCEYLISSGKLVEIVESVVGEITF